MTNIAMENHHFNGKTHYKWAIYTMAMLNNQRAQSVLKVKKNNGG